MTYSLFIVMTVLLVSLFFNFKQRREIEKFNNSEFSLVKKAYFNPITELPNRENLNIVVGEQISRAARHQKHFVIVAIKIENYRDVKRDSHKIANELIEESGDRLFDLLRDEDNLSHISEDLFIIVFNEYLKEKDLSIIFKRIKKAFRKINSTDLDIVISLGSSLYPIDAKDTKGLLDKAKENVYEKI